MWFFRREYFLCGEKAVLSSKFGTKKEDKTVIMRPCLRKSPSENEQDLIKINPTPNGFGMTTRLLIINLTSFTQAMPYFCQ